MCVAASYNHHQQFKLLLLLLGVHICQSLSSDLL